MCMVVFGLLLMWLAPAPMVWYTHEVWAGHATLMLGALCMGVGAYAELWSR